MTSFAHRFLWFLGMALLLRPGLAQAADMLLAMTWHPGFCAQRPTVAECRVSDAPVGLVLHGLWPQGGQGGEFCGVTPDVRALDRQRKWCDLPPVSLSKKVADATDKVMPGRKSCLDRHEWHRHGTCAGLPADAYFERASSLAARVGPLAINALLKARAGKGTTSEDLHKAVVQDFGRTSSGAVAMICTKRGDRFHFTEVRILLDGKSQHLFPSPASLSKTPLRGGRRCPARGAIVVDSQP